ncbi:hypothetical protein PS647_04159 [Pseudomonas fluorescens]|nr:hypothetical protein PS647_04159 [Pseudomonas fluorescens]
MNNHETALSTNTDTDTDTDTDNTTRKTTYIKLNQPTLNHLKFSHISPKTNNIFQIKLNCPPLKKTDYPLSETASKISFRH